MAIFRKQRSVPSSVKEMVMPVVFFIALVLICWVGLSNISRTTQSEQLKAAQQAVRRAAVQCYALEGSYPPNISYLEENYGLIIDHDRYIVHYQSLGTNLMPQIAVFSLGGEANLSPSETLLETAPGGE